MTAQRPVRSTPVRSRAMALKLALGVAALAAGGGGYVIFAKSKAPSASDKAAALTADKGVIKTMSFDIVTTSNGVLEAKKQIEIRSQLEVEAKIVKIVPEGSFAKKDDVLVELNSDKIDSQIADEQIQVDTANAEKLTADNNYKIQLTDNQTKIRQAELKVELAKLALEQWEKGDVKKQREANTLALEKAKRDRDRLEEKRDNSRKLFNATFLSKNEMDLDEIAFIEAEAALQKAGTEHDIYENYTYPKEQKKNNSDVEDALAELEHTKLNAASEQANKEAALSRAVKTLKQRSDNLEKFKKQKAACTVTAPSDGLVVYGTTLERSRFRWSSNGPMQIGSDVFPNMLLIGLPDTTEMVASVKVPETLAGRIAAGQSATIRVDAQSGHSLTGQVESIGVLAEQDGWRDTGSEYTVKIKLDAIDAQAGLKPSMRCEAEILVGRVENVLTAPVQAVFNDGAVCFCYVPEGSKFSRLPVKLGRKSDAYAEVTGGLSEGQVVLLREPTAGEVLSRPWDKAQLTACGYEVGEDGVAFVAGKGPGGPGGKGRPGRGAPKGAPAVAGAGDVKVVTTASTTAEPKPEAKPETKPDAKPTPEAAKPADQGAEKLADATPEKPAEKPAEKSADKPAEPAPAKADEKPAEKKPDPKAPTRA